MPHESNHYSIWILLVLVTVLSLVATVNGQQSVPGLTVEEVVAGSASAKAGIKPGDRLLTYDNKELISPAAFLALQENTFAKKEVELSVRRNEEKLTLSVPIGVLGIKVRPDLSAATLKLYEEANKAFEKKSAEGIVKLKGAAKVSADSGAKSAAAWLFGQAGEYYESQKKWKEAITEYEAALEVLKESTDEAAWSRTMFALGRCYGEIEDFRASGQWLERAGEVDLKLGNEMWVARDLDNLGLVVHFEGDLQAAKDYHSRALAIRERLAPNSLVVAASLNNLGVVAYNLGDFEAAQDLYSGSLAIRERLAPTSPGLASSLNNLGVVASRRGDL